MLQYKSVNVKLSNSQLDKLKLVTKRATEISLRLLLNMIGYFNDEINLPHKLWLAERKVTSLQKASEKN